MLLELEAGLEQREAPGVTLSSQEQRKLASLGYTGGGGTDDKWQSLPDIKDMLPHYRSHGSALRLIGESRFKDAAELLEPVVRGAPKYFQAWYNLGVCYQRTGRLAEAETAFQRAVEIDGNAWAQLALAKVQVAQDEPREAIPHLEAVTRLQPTLPEGWFLLGEAYRMSGRNEEARRQYQEALAVEPRYLPAREALQGLR
jgi:Flp pilus assembly protein TadD